MDNNIYAKLQVLANADYEAFTSFCSSSDEMEHSLQF